MKKNDIRIVSETCVEQNYFQIYNDILVSVEGLIIGNIFSLLSLEIFVDNSKSKIHEYSFSI